MVNQRNKYKYDLITPATLPLLNLSNVKTYLNITGTDYDGLLSILIPQAVEICENITGRTLKTKEYRLSTYYCSSVIISKPPLISVDKVEYFNGDIWQEILSSEYTLIKEDGYTTLCFNDTNLSSLYLDCCSDYNLRIEFTAGYGVNDSDLPSSLLLGLYSHIAFLFNNRGDCLDCSGGEQMIYDKYYKPYIIPKKLVAVV